MFLPRGPPLFLFFFLHAPPPFFCSPYSCFLFVSSFFFPFSASAFFLRPWCARCAVLGLVCVSWAVGCAGVCCCGRCAPAEAALRLRCVVGCSLVVPVLCVLLPVVWRCCGVFCVLPGAVWRACVGLSSCTVLLAPVAVAWSPVVARGCVLSWCCVALVCRPSCGVLLSALCLAGGAVLFLSRWLVLCDVACGCRPFVAGSGCLLFFLRRRVLSRVLLPGLLCALVCCGTPLPCACPVFCGAVLPCGAVLWRPAVRFPSLVVLVCVLSLCVRCCVALRVVVFGASLVCAIVGASCCCVLLCVVVSPLAFCGVVVLLWCVVVTCCAVLCSVVLRRLLVPW